MEKQTTEGQGSEKKNQFGTFTGVFTPSILTILGVIMFMRSPFVIGQAGIFGALVILFAAKLITVLTSFSISAVSTNMQVRGGGAYYLISRVLGPAFGGSIGMALFFALALSVPFYVLGFAEALCVSYPELSIHFLKITLFTAALFFAVAYVGAGWALRIQFFIMFALILSLIVFLGGAWQNFSMDIFKANWQSGYTAAEGGAKYSFWLIFAIYFPAVTGIGAGLNMSGDLEEPEVSIPKGTLWAVAAGFAVYLLQIIICGGAFDRTDLINAPYDILRENALFGLSFIVAGGVFAATLSSALGSYLGAPRVLQAVSRDPVMLFLKPFGKGSVKGDEPRRALLLTAVITFGVLLWAGNEAEGASLNAVAAVITMFFLYTYGMINFAAFVEAAGNNPSFRPRFKYFNWLLALLGALGCIGVSFLINALAAVIAVVIIAALFWYIRTRQLKSTFGDARRGFIYSNVRKNLLWLNTMTEDSRNWRPTILVFTANPESREKLTTYAVWLESGRGFVILTQLLVGKFEELAPRREAAEKQLKNLCQEKDIQAFPLAAVSENLEQGIEMILQTASVGPIKPNLAVFGWTGRGNAEKFASHLRMSRSLGMSLVVVKADNLPDYTSKKKKKYVDLWWRGRKNGGIMIILAWLLTQNWEWEGVTVRVLRVVDNDAGKDPAAEALRELTATARVDAEVKTIVSEAPFRSILHEHSKEAECVIFGFEPPEEGHAESWKLLYDSYIRDLPAAILVSSAETEDLLE
ncbi:MAG: amino acid permease [Planctomycetota bacterium]|jgi:amino acid transporter